MNQNDEFYFLIILKAKNFSIVKKLKGKKIKKLKKDNILRKNRVKRTIMYAISKFIPIDSRKIIFTRV